MTYAIHNSTTKAGFRLNICGHHQMEKLMARTVKPMLFLLIGISISLAIFAQNVSQTAFPEANAFVDVYFKHKKIFVDDIQIDEINIKKPKNSRVVAIESMGEFPLNIVILLDTSGSRHNHFDQLRQFYVGMIELLPLRPVDSVSLIAVSHKIRSIQDATFDKSLLLEGFYATHFMGGTRLNDAIYFVSGAFEDQKYSRKAMIVLSDGEDADSTKTMEEAYQNAIENNVRVYMFVEKEEQRSGFSLWSIKGESRQKEVRKHEKHSKKTGGNLFKYPNIESAKEQLIQMIDEWSHLKRVRLSVEILEESKSDLEISVSRKGVKAFYPSAPQYISDKSH